MFRAHIIALEASSQPIVYVTRCIFADRDRERERETHATEHLHRRINFAINILILDEDVYCRTAFRNMHDDVVASALKIPPGLR